MISGLGARLGLLVAGTLVCCTCGSRERVLLTGQFHSVAHKGSGSVKVVTLPAGGRRLRLVDVATYPSPDLQVCLLAAPDAEDNATVLQSRVVCLGAYDRRKTVYDVPTDVDLEQYRAVVVWNRAYRVNFTTAPLEGR